MATYRPYSLRRIVMQIDEAERLNESDEESDQTLAYWLWCSAFDAVPARRLAKVKQKVACLLKRPVSDFWQREGEG